MQPTNNPSSPNKIIIGHPRWAEMMNIFHSLAQSMTATQFTGSNYQYAKPLPTGGHRRPGYQQTDEDHINIANAEKKRHRRRMKRAVYQHRCESHNPCLSAA